MERSFLLINTKIMIIIITNVKLCFEWRDTNGAGATAGYKRYRYW